MTCIPKNMFPVEQKLTRAKEIEQKLAEARENDSPEEIIKLLEEQQKCFQECISERIEDTFKLQH